MYSPWATAMPGLLTYGMQGKNSAKCASYQACKDVFEHLLDRARIHLAFRINNDMILFEELFRELDRRQVAVGKDSIVLIGEWDSFYARALPITFSAAACRHIGRRCATRQKGSRCMRTRPRASPHASAKSQADGSSRASGRGRSR